MIRFTSLLSSRGLGPTAMACAFLLATAAPSTWAQSTSAPALPASSTQAPPAAQSPPSSPANTQAPAQPQSPNQAQPGVQTTQPGQDQNQPGQYTIPVEVNEVNLIFTVIDKHGHFVKDLKQSDFALLDDRKAPAQVYSFAQQTNLPLRVGVLIDTSTSIRRRFEFEQQATSEFLLDVLHPRTDRGFVMGFDVQPDLKQDWTSNLDLLNTGVNALRPGGGTALYDALYTACRDKMLTSARGQEPLHKALILISDGDDNQSRAYLDDAIKMCQRAETIVYAISTNTSPTRERGDDVLNKISAATGGRAFFPQRLEDMSNHFKEIQDELRSQYALVYKPADFKMDGAFRSIYLFCLDRRYTVRARTGYFAPRP